MAGDHTGPERPSLLRRLIHPAIDDNPVPHELADDSDDLDWNVERDGRMAHYATDDEPATEAWGD